MPAQRAFKQRSVPWRKDAYAAININWKQISPDGDRDERLAWISSYLGHEITSLTELTDDQLGAVAGEMKRLTGRSADAPVRIAGSSSDTSGRNRNPSNVIDGQFGTPEEPALRARVPAAPVESEVVHLATPEQVYTLTKLIDHIGWGQVSIGNYFTRRYGTAKLAMLTFAKANAATNALLHVAAHRDLKKRKGGDKPVSRAEINKYIPILKEQLGIDRSQNRLR